MATIHFVKDGKRANGERITKSFDTDIDAAVQHLAKFSTQHFDTPPTINPEVQASDWAEYKHVVLKVASGEEKSAFPQPGYYYIPSLTPLDCEALLGIDTSEV